MALRKEEEKLYTYEDYLALDDEHSYEVIDGLLYYKNGDPSAMAGVRPFHQDIVGNLSALFRTLFKGKGCKPYTSPVDLVLATSVFGDIIVQPDVFLICDKNQINEKNVTGVPTLIIEVLSPSSTKMDRLIKYKKYEQAGVAEYWIVDPDARLIEVYTLVADKYQRAAYDEDDTITLSQFSDISIDVTQIFEDSL